MIDELEIMWKEALLVYYKVLFQNLPERTEEINRKLHDNWLPCWEQNLGPTKYKTWMLNHETTMFSSKKKKGKAVLITGREGP
jgi:hypothetical protein